MPTSAADVDPEARAGSSRHAASPPSGSRGTPWRTNAQVPGPWLRGGGGCIRAAAADRALELGGITMRGYDRVLKTARTCF